jgi:hypothetical protein
MVFVQQYTFPGTRMVFRRRKGGLYKVMSTIRSPDEPSVVLGRLGLSGMCMLLTRTCQDATFSYCQWEYI